MSGTSAGARKGVKTKKLWYGNTHYEVIGREGGKKSTYRHFNDPEKARQAANIRHHGLSQV